MREEALLAQAHVLTKKHEELAAATGQNFNLFKVLGRETDEVRTHSAIIAELLNPKGSHGQGPVFARLFAEQFELPVKGIESARVWTELTVDEDSRIDILMVVDDLCVVVENKIHADDRLGQIMRYHEYAAKWPQSKVVYLTLHGEVPSEDSLGSLDQSSRDKIDCRSYKSDVLAWLDGCIKEVARVPQIREILVHYEELIRKLTGKSKGELIMDLKELLAKKQDDNTYNFEIAPKIAEAMTEFSIDTEWDYWKRLKERLLEDSHRPWRLETFTVANASNAPKEVARDKVDHAHGTANKNKWRYGWTFRIESQADPDRYRRDGIEVLLRIECDNWGWGFYGFIAVEQTSGRPLSRTGD